MNEFMLPKKYQDPKPIPPVVNKFTVHNKVRFYLPKFKVFTIKSNRAKSVFALLVFVLVALPAVVFMNVWNADQQAQASLIAYNPDRTASKVQIQNFTEIDFHRSPNSNIEITSSLISLKPNTCQSVAQPEDENCRLLFHPNEENLQTEIGSVIKSINVGSQVSPDSLIIVEHIDANQNLVAKLGEITSQNNYSEINIPISFGTQDALRIIFWNVIPEQDGLSNPSVATNPSPQTVFGRYCNVEYKTTNVWNQGYSGNIRITNKTTQNMADWALSYKLSGSHKIDKMWNGIISRNGSNVTVSPTSWTRNVNPNGGVVEINFTASYTGKMVEGKDFKLNDIECNEDTTYSLGNLSCQVEYMVVNNWGSGFTGKLKIYNLAASSINKWQLEYNFLNQQRVYEAWGGKISQKDSLVMVKDAGYNGLIKAGEYAEVGFNAFTQTDWNNQVSIFKLNGVPCTAQRSYKHGIQINDLSLKYLQYDRLLSVVVAITTSDLSQLDLNTAKMYYDNDRDQLYDVKKDILWECRDKFPGVKTAYDKDRQIIQLVRDDSCLNAAKPISWETEGVAMPPGNWLIVIEEGKKVIPFALADDGSISLW